MLVPIARHEGRGTRERPLEMLEALDADHATEPPPGADQTDSERHRDGIQHPPRGSHAASRARGGAVDGVAQAAAVLRAHEANNSASSTAWVSTASTSMLETTQAEAPS